MNLSAAGDYAARLRIARPRLEELVARRDLTLFYVLFGRARRAT